MADEFAAIASEALAAAGLDRRLAFVRVRPDPAGGLRCETSEPRLLDPLLARLGAPAGAGPVRGVALPEPELQGLRAWVTSSVAEVRALPAHAAEQLTQALQGEALVPLVHEDGWVLARLLDGYLGWVRDWHLALVPATVSAAFALRTAARLDVPWGPIRCEPRPDADPCGETLLGTRVAIAARAGGWTEIELPGGRRGWVPDGWLSPGSGPWPLEAPRIIATLARFLGVPYLWGGRSSKGFDCSGLVQFAFGLHGLELPRDSDQQARCGTEVESPAPGDLLFFGQERVTHVAVALDGGQYLHARGEVRRNSLRPGSSLYDADLHSLRRGTRRILPPTG